MFVRSGDQHYNLATVASIEVCHDGYVRLYPKLNCSAYTAFAGEAAELVRRHLATNRLQPDPTPVLPVAEEPTDAPNEALTKAATSYRGPGYATKSEPDHYSIEAEIDSAIAAIEQKYRQYGIVITSAIVLGK